MNILYTQIPGNPKYYVFVVNQERRILGYGEGLGEVQSALDYAYSESHIPNKIDIKSVPMMSDLVSLQDIVKIPLDTWQKTWQNYQSNQQVKSTPIKKVKDHWLFKDLDDDIIC